MPEDHAGDHIPVGDTLNSNELDVPSIPDGEVSLTFDTDRKYRIAIIGGNDRIGDIDTFKSLFENMDVSFIAAPDTSEVSGVYEAGIVAAAADVIIFDLASVDFGEMLEILFTTQKYVPRAIAVALLEEGSSSKSLPQCGIHLSVTPPFSPRSLVSEIEHLILGT